MGVFSNIVATHDDGLRAIEQYYNAGLIQEVEPNLVYSKDCQKRSLPPNNGKVVTFYSYDPFPVSQEPLKEGVTPDGQTVNVRKFTATVKPYGNYIAWTDELSRFGINWMHKETSRRLNQQALETIDAIVADVMNGGLNVIYADENGGVNTSRSDIAANTDVLTYTHLKKAVRALEKNGAKRFSDGFFHAVVGPETKYDLTEMSQWVDIAKYQDKQKIEKYELGCIAGIKFYETTRSKIFHPTQYLYTDSGTGVSNLALAAGMWSVAKKTGYMSVARTTAYASGTTADYAHFCRRMAGQKVRIFDASATAYMDALIDKCEDDGTNLVMTLRYVDTATDWTYASGDKVYSQAGGASSTDVYSTIVYGMDYCGIISLGGRGENIRAIVKEPGSSGAEDPLNQRGTIAWKVDGFTACILQNAYGVRIEHSVSA